jgi:hypothetical protein
MPEHWVGLALFAAAAMLTTSVAHAQAAPAKSGRSARSPTLDVHLLPIVKHVTPQVASLTMISHGSSGRAPCLS